MKCYPLQLKAMVLRELWNVIHFRTPRKQLKRGEEVLVAQIG